jgi:NAD(P)-dependent dehydrogenase (short-subunit alcohol dehydrogenase family)
MHLQGKRVVVTGGAHGIGKAMCERFAREGARKVVVADLDGVGAGRVAESIDGVGVRCDVAVEAEVAGLVAFVEEELGPIDLFCSNAGIAFGDGPDGRVASLPNDAWRRAWEVNVMAHVYAVRAALPAMIARGEGYFLHTSSAAGLLSQIGDASYSTTKHAAIGFAESLAITHGDDGIKVSVLCPQGVRTRMTEGRERSPEAGDGMLEPEQVADAVVRGLDEERFLILPHAEVLEYMRRKTSDYDRWIKGMRRFRRTFV